MCPFYRATLDNASTVLSIINTITGNNFGASADMIMKLKNPNFYIFISESNKSLLSFEPVFGNVPWYLVHTFCSKEERGLKLKLFLMGTALWMVENTKAEAFMAVIPEDLKRYGLFLSSVMGMTNKGKEQDCTIYTIGLDRYDEMKDKYERLLKR